MGSRFRTENKYLITSGKARLIAGRLQYAMRRDANSGPDGKYWIGSVYFDDAYRCALWDKLSGYDDRKKFRIRSYNNSADFIKLEKKEKCAGLTRKTVMPISAKEYRAVLAGDIAFLLERREGLAREFYAELRASLRPAKVIYYTREAFVYPAGNVRVTLDSSVAVSEDFAGFLNPGRDIGTEVTGDTSVVLEVKYDSFLPDFIARMVELPVTRQGISKYALGYTY